MLKMICSLLLFVSTGAIAGWTANLGYNNPPGAIGLNFLYLGTQWGFEAGVGKVNANSTTDDSTTKNDESSSSLALSGDLNLKYFLSRSSFSPYLQGGVGAGLGASNSGVGAGLGGGFLGLGLMIGNEGFHLYAGVIGAKSFGAQIGLGMKI